MTIGRTAALAAAAVFLIGAGPPAVPTFSPVQTQFALRCGGCHGIGGRSPPASVPVLKGRAGYFLCTPESRRFVLSLPNVSGVQLSDEKLADVLNYVMLDLGRVEGVEAAPFTAEEVRVGRGQPAPPELMAQRGKVVRSLMRRCQAPKDMLNYTTVASPGRSVPPRSGKGSGNQAHD